MSLMSCDFPEKVYNSDYFKKHPPFSMELFSKRRYDTTISVERGSAYLLFLKSSMVRECKTERERERERQLVLIRERERSVSRERDS